MKAALLVLAGALPVALVAAAPAAPKPEPEQGRFVVLEPVRGDVEVRPAGARRYRDLEARTRFPVGVTVDAQEGAVRLIVSRGDGKGVSRAIFSQGKFTVTQDREGDPLATLRLTGPSYAEVCNGATASAKRRKRVRRLWGDGKGSFRTSGRYSAATVRGTKWLTEDRCDGTITRVVRGEVRVDDFGAIPTPTPEPTEPPVPPPAGAPGGGGAGGGEPAVRPVTDGSGDDVIVSAGGRYVARP
ncbi:MAG: hypothetical protein ABW081_06635 [Solirubrobacteraceae bacterium]